MQIPFYNNPKSGIPKIEIPVRLKDLDEETIKYYLPQCVAQLKQNAIKIRYLKQFVDGTHQDIDDKEYALKTSGNAKGKYKENHAYEIVQFKEGFRLGNKRQLVNKEGIDNNDVSFLEKFMTDVNADSKIIEWVYDLYATGIGTTFILPRGDIFEDTTKEVNGVMERKVEYKKNDEYDVNVQSPFTYETVNSEENAVVYSSCIGESGLKDLFCINIANMLDKTTKQPQEVVTVYTREKIYEWRSTNGVQELTTIAYNYAYGCLPMTEHALNNTRISPVEVVYDLLNVVNLLLSLETNSVEDKVNQLLVFIGCDLDQKDVDALYHDGVIVLAPTAMGNPDVKAISNDLKYSETNVLMERVLTRMFDIVGVPLASASVSSGNNEAAYLGGGWTNAKIIMNRDIIYGEKSEREELRKIIKICKLNPDNPVQSIHANEIDIKYNINQSNNLLVKTQGMQNLYDIGVAIPDIVKTSGTFGDEEGVAKRWIENLKKKFEQEIEKAKQLQQTALTGDNLTGAQKQQEADQTQAEQTKGVN